MKPHTIKVFCNDKDYRAIKRCADQDNRSISNFGLTAMMLLVAQACNQNLKNLLKEKKA